MSKIKVVTFVPLENADAVRQALGDAGAGVMGEYTYCSYSVVGRGRFMPSDSAHPHIGNPGTYETVDEERIEVVCERANAKAVIAALRAAHPYEEVAFDILQLLDESEL